MDSNLLLHLIIFTVLIFISAFFAAVETSLLSLPRPALERYVQGKGLLSLAFKEWQDHPNRILTAILFGNNAVNTIATTLAAYTGVRLAEIHQWNQAETATIVSILVTIVIIVFGEVIPKITGRSHAVVSAPLLVVPIYLFDRLLTPLSWVLGQVVGRIFPSFGQSAVALVTEEDIKHMIEVGQKEGTIHEDEKNMIQSIFKFTDTRVSEVMIPRTEMYSIDLDTSVEALTDSFIQHGYSRVPVFKGNRDNIVGIIHTRDLLTLSRNRELILLHDLLRKPYFVPETMRVDRLLHEFQRGRMHMAIVVDEYGGTAGLVTLEDLLEEIVGDIRDEHEGEEESSIVKQEDGSYLVDASLPLDEVNEALGIHLTAKGLVNTLGGYLVERAGRVPKKGRVVEGSGSDLHCYRSQRKTGVGSPNREKGSPLGNPRGNTEAPEKKSQGFTRSGRGGKPVNESSRGNEVMSYLDCHNHTAEWSDGRQSIEQVLERSKAEGVRVGLADHAGLGEYLNSNDRLLAYGDFLSQYPVARGLEMDLGRSFTLSPETRSKFDYMIGSVHGIELHGLRMGFAPLIKFLKGGLPDYNPTLQVKDWDHFFNTHLEVLEREYQTQKYDILGHCTMLPALVLGKPEEAFPEWWEERLIHILLMYGVAMEVSNRWLTPYERLMKKAVDAGVRFSVGSDGHEPAKTCVLDFPKKMLEKYGVKADRIFDIKRKIEAA